MRVAKRPRYGSAQEREAKVKRTKEGKARHSVNEKRLVRRYSGKSVEGGSWADKGGEMGLFYRPEERSGAASHTAVRIKSHERNKHLDISNNGRRRSLGKGGVGRERVAPEGRQPNAPARKARGLPYTSAGQGYAG